MVAPLLRTTHQNKATTFEMKKRVSKYPMHPLTRKNTRENHV